MSVSIYLNKINKEDFCDNAFVIDTIGSKISFYENENEDISEYDLAILGLIDFSSDNEEHLIEVRKQLYKLYPSDYKLKIIDLGNIKQGNKTSDTDFAIVEVISELISNKVIPIIIGYNKENIINIYKSYKKLSKTINMVVADKKLNLFTDNGTEYIFSKIIEDKPNYLFNYSNIGYQKYFNNIKEIELINKLYFEAYRLGVAQQNIDEMEPVIRDAETVCFNLSSIRASDAIGTKDPSPNGFYGEELCKLSWFAGMNDKLTSVSFFEYDKTNDKNLQTSMLLAQVIWHFIEGYYNRKNDFPDENIKDYLKYYVSLANENLDISFIKSKKTDRWWMKLPINNKLNLNIKFVACSYSDYKNALNNEIPNRLLNVYKKIVN